MIDDISLKSNCFMSCPGGLFVLSINSDGDILFKNSKISEAFRTNKKLASSLIENIIKNKEKKFEINISRAVPIWLEFTCSVKKSELAGEECIWAIGSEITRYKEMETVLRKSQKKLSIFFDNSSDIVFSSDINGIIYEINNAAVKKLGFSEKPDLMGRNILDFYIRPDDRIYFLKKIKEDGQIKDFEINLQCQNGKILIGLETSMLMEKNIYFSTIKDITNRVNNNKELWKMNLDLIETNRKLEKIQLNMLNQEKLASIGQLAAGVAHEINNPLGFVNSNHSIIKKYLNKIINFIEEIKKIQTCKSIMEEQYNKYDIDYIISDFKNLLAESKDGLVRIKSIIQSLKYFSRIDASCKMENYDLNKAIESTLAITKNEYKNIIEIQTSLSEIPSIRCNGQEINQVLLNIIINAIHALKGKSNNNNPVIGISTYLKKEYVVCEISDTGAGIPEENRNKLFDPFFTTKPIGTGTGLGLSISYDIVVNKHRGKLYFKSLIGKKTTFYIELPREV